MPFAPESFIPLDDALNRLATESIFAQLGRDDGLIPSYSLLGEIRDLCAGEPMLTDAVNRIHGLLDRLLDTGQPFDGEALGGLRQLIDWLPGALTAAKAGEVPLPFQSPKSGVSGVSGESTAPTAETAIDVILELNLGENKELLGEFYSEAVDHLHKIEAALLVLDQQPRHPDALNSIFRSFHTIKGNAGFLGLGPMQALAHEVESLLDLARNQQLLLTPPIITEILRSRDALQAHTQQIAVALEKGQLPTKVVPVSHLVAAVKALAQDAMVPGPLDATSVAVAAPVVPFDSSAASAATPAPGVSVPVDTVAMANALEVQASGKSSTGNQTVRVNTEKLDSLMDVVGELAIVQSQLIESVRRFGGEGSPLQRNVAQLSRIAKELQNTAMSLRMIPVKQTFQKMERLARDLSRNFGKKVIFQVGGEDTELDRTVVEEIADPLVHMVRNALDHGLELPADRVAQGKPEQGTVQLRAYHLGTNIVIELQDDGRGIDPERIFQKAVEKGIIDAQANLTRDEIFGLVFAPGFSTAEKVTAVSGRGVGMDVVKRNIEKLRGKIEITSEVGRGSTFKIKLPLTLAIIDGLVVRVGADKFILPSTSVQMALRPKREDLSTVHGSGEVLEWRGRILPVHRLHRRFNIPADTENPWEGMLVIVEHAGRISALLVDEMVSKQEVVIKNLGAFMQGLPGVSGAAILGDGNIALILDPTSLLQAA